MTLPHIYIRRTASGIVKEVGYDGMPLLGVSDAAIEFDRVTAVHTVTLTFKAYVHVVEDAEEEITA